MTLGHSATKMLSRIGSIVKCANAASDSQCEVLIDWMVGERKVTMNKIKRLRWIFLPKASTIFPVMTIFAMGLPVVYNIAFGQSFENGFASGRIVNVQADRLAPLLSVLSLDGQQHNQRTTHLRVEAPTANIRSRKFHPRQTQFRGFQEDLALQGVYSNSITGELDSATPRGNQELSNRSGFTVTGEPSVKLAEALEFARQISNAANFTAGIASWQTSLLVRNIQSALKNRGYDPGPIDGKLGEKTRLAMERFQNQTDILSNGQVTQDLLRELHIDEVPRFAKRLN